MSKVLVVGGGAAGMMAAVHAARNGNEVHLFEKNEKLGRKIYITGKGRCNLTNACDIEELFASVRRNEKFLYSAFYGFSNDMTMAFFEEAGCPLKVERGNRVFPVSDHASDVIRALVSEMKKAGVAVHLNARVTQLMKVEQEDGIHVSGLMLENKEVFSGDKVILAAGGKSYPSTGSTGEGYCFAEAFGHKVTSVQPSLVPFEVEEEYVKQLQGLSLRNVEVTVCRGKKKLFQDFGEMLFTHFGVSGPLILTASTYVGDSVQGMELSIDLKPALTREQLDARILRDFEENKNKQFRNCLGKLLPVKLIPVIIALSGIPEEKRIHEITKQERMALLQVLKHFPMTISGLRGFNEAIVTRGGVSVKEVNPSTMESVLCRGLYFAGEVLDLDAVTGGFNLQIAWSTGYLAGISV